MKVGGPRLGGWHEAREAQELPDGAQERLSPWAVSTLGWRAGEHRVTWEDLGDGCLGKVVSPSPHRADDASEGQRKEGEGSRPHSIPDPVGCGGVRALA